MSFFKKLKAEFDDLMGDDKDKKKKEDKPVEASHDTPRDNSQVPYGGQSQQQYGQPPSQSQYGNPPMQQHGYGGPPPGQPHLPPGWIQQWDQNSQRYYYLEQATGRTQWEPPSTDRGYASQPPAQQYGYQSNPGQQTYGAPMQNQMSGYPQGQYAGQPVKNEKKSGKGGMIAAGAGGMAVGALAGAALSGDSSDEEHNRAAYGAPQQGYYSSAPAPVRLEDNPELSSSQRSSLEEARKDYEKAQREVAEDSDPSSSDLEDLQEAREEYHSEVESAHSELED